MSAKIVQATAADVSDILRFIRDLAIYEKLEHEVIATEETLRETLFGKNKYAEVVFLEDEDKRVGFALYFHNYSTFLAKPGIYLEDLFVLPEYRGRGYGKILLSYLAKIARQRNCGRLEWSVLDWNTPAIEFYKSIGAVQKEDWIVNRLTGENLHKLSDYLPG